jgi:phosphatidylinositol alpha-1,6-mannosyltransferase
MLRPNAVEPFWPFRVRRLPGLRGTHGPASQWATARALVAGRHALRDATICLAEPGPMLALMSLQFFPTFRPRRLVLTFHGSEILRFHTNPVTRLLVRRLIGHATRVSTLTHYTQQLLCARFPTAAAKHVLTPGALRSGFAAAAPVRRPADGKLVVLTVGRLHPRKGQLETLTALAALPPSLRANLEYWLVGTAVRRPDYEKQLRATAGRAGLTVKFLGDLSATELAAAYARADIFAMTSVDHGHSVEGFGLVYLEASAHGLPVVAHAVGGVAEAVADNITGLLVPPREPVRLTAALARLLGDDSLRRRLGEAGPAWAARTTWAHSAELLFSAPPSTLP